MAELSFGMDETQRPLSIYEVTRLIDLRIHAQPGLANIYVKGEITDFKVQPSSGHAYFTLSDKDAETNGNKKSVLKCTFFRYNSYKQNSAFTPRPGMEVLVYGGISVYYQGGQYNFNAREIIEVGLGRLMIKIQELRTKLIKEGVINPELRKTIPEIPRKLGVVTGMGTAALKDILKQVNDRYPNVNVVICPALVQGTEAPQSIANAIREISKPQWGCDVIIVGRGGGSQEDLMAFNEEVVCRAIFECPVPVISAVGHQIDHPVSDDVADMAAATPTDAAKIALPVIHEKLEDLEMLFKHLNNLVVQQFKLAREKLLRITQKPFFVNPEVLITEYYRGLDDKEARLKNALLFMLDRVKNRMRAQKDIHDLWEKQLMTKRYAFNQLSEMLLAFSPLATLKRGYCVAYQDDALVKSVADVRTDSDMNIRMQDGTVQVKPLSVKPA